MKCTDELLSTQVLDRLLRYVRIETTSDRHAETVPSTPGQWELLKLLEGELREIGVADTALDENGFLIARIPGNRPNAPTIGFMAHVDTASDVTAANVDPIVHNDYDGSVIELADGIAIDPRVEPLLDRYRGATIVTSDGTTLLGADDKAGVAEMMTLAECLVREPEIPHGEIELIFTPDEEIGRGMDYAPREKLRSLVCHTVDGSDEGVIETECFNAVKVDLTFRGISTHTGTARGRLVNAISMLSSLLSMMPRSESPEATDGRYGFYAPIEVHGTVERATCSVLIRDFESDEIARRISALRSLALAVEAAFPGGKVDVDEEKQYSNMRTYFDADPRIVGNLETAVRMTGIEPESRLIRGGTDGSRLSEMGIPTPNIFTGGQNYHSRSEWAAVPAMVRTVHTLVNLCALWAKA